MSNDLLFSALPRRGTIQVTRGIGEVKRVEKKTPTHESPSDENLPKVREKHQDAKNTDDHSERQSKDYSDEHVGLIVDTTDDSTSENPDNTLKEQSSDEYTSNGKEEKEETHLGTKLDISV